MQIELILLFMDLNEATYLLNNSNKDSKKGTL